MDYIVIHNVSANRFEVLLENGQTAYLDYNETETGLNYAHTYVPKAFEGKGIAATIVRFALDYAKENDIPITPSCPYVSVYIERHSSYKELIK